MAEDKSPEEPQGLDAALDRLTSKGITRDELTRAQEMLRERRANQADKPGGRKVAPPETPEPGNK